MSVVGLFDVSNRLHCVSILGLCFYRAISGKNESVSKHRDSIIIKEARSKQQQAAPAPSAAPGKPKLAALGFASVDDTAGDAEERSALPSMPSRPAPVSNLLVSLIDWIASV